MKNRRVGSLFVHPMPPAAATAYARIQVVSEQVE